MLQQPWECQDHGSLRSHLGAQAIPTVAVTRAPLQNQEKAPRNDPHKPGSTGWNESWPLSSPRGKASGLWEEKAKWGRHVLCLPRSCLVPMSQQAASTGEEVSTARAKGWESVTFPVVRRPRALPPQGCPMYNLCCSPAYKALCFANLTHPPRPSSKCHLLQKTSWCPRPPPAAPGPAQTITITTARPSTGHNWLSVRLIN